MLLNNVTHPYLVTYDTNNPENRPTTDNTYLLARGLTSYDYWFCQFSDHNSFKIYPIETLVPADILQRVRNKAAYLVLDNANECFYSSVDGVYEHVVIAGKIPASQVILVTGGYDVAPYAKQLAKHLGQDDIIVEWFTGQEFSIQKQMEVSGKRLIDYTLEIKSYPKKFLNLNRRWRLHRPAMTALLYEKNLIKDGYVSFDKTDEQGRTWDDGWYGVKAYYSAFPQMLERLEKGYGVKDLLPLYVDTTDLATNRDFMQDSTDAFYLDTYFSLVSETTYNTRHRSDGRFPTEKTFKSIAMGHPFILVALPGSLEMLKSLGYKTFNGLIDEDYDKELDDGLRMLKIVDEVHRLCNLTENELINFLVEAKKICRHNFDVLMNQKKFCRTLSVPSYFLNTYDLANPIKTVTPDNDSHLIKRTVDYVFFQIANADSLKIYPLSKILSEEQLQHVKNKKLSIVIDNSDESYQDVVEVIYENVIENNLPPDQIILMTGSPSTIETVKAVSQKYGLSEIKVEWSLACEYAIKNTYPYVFNKELPRAIEHKEYEKKFIMPNRRWRLHRPALVAAIHSKNLLDKGLISLAPADDNQNWETVYGGLRTAFGSHTPFHDILQKEAKNKGIGNLYIDTTDLVTNRVGLSFDIKSFYEQVYFSVVTETTYFCNEPVFLTEKTFKSIAMQRPFILVSVPNSLQYLKNLGYKTFEEIIDESYDREIDDAKRLLMIADEIERLSNLQGAELARFIATANEICYHNVNVLRNKKSFIFGLN